MRQLKTILVVDDEPRTRSGIQATLERWSEGRFQVRTADNGYEALNLCKEEMVHLLVTDIRMPEMSGLQLLEKIGEETSRKPVAIVISGYAEFQYAQQALQLGVVNYLLKPFTKSMLIQAVEEACRIEERLTQVNRLEQLMDPKLLAASENEPVVSEPVRQAIDYITKHLQEPIGLKEISEHVHLTPAYFSTLFKEQMKLTLTEYVTRTRLQKAKELLRSTRLPIAEISELVGYQTQKYFNKLFREYEGMSPGQYRSRHL